MKIESGESVVVVLHTPREKLLGVLDEISPAGISVRSVDLSYFDDWCSSIANGEPYLPMTDSFVPMWRVEKLSRDAGTEDSPSLTDQFRRRTGRELAEF